MSIKALLENENIYESAQNIKYLYVPSKKPSQHLVVVLSGFNPKGTRPAYNYIRTLQNIDINKLYILDDQGERGCYYLGQDRKFDVEASVSSLITYIANRKNILHKNIICCGSSKGGYASLYYAIKYNLGYAIVGAPQTYLGNYLMSACEYPTLKFIAGDCTKESVDFLNDILFDVIEKSSIKSKIMIHVGSGDHHYKDHVIPLINILREKDINVNLDVQEYNDHSDVSYYQKFLLNELKIIDPSLKDSFEIKEVNLNIYDRTVELVCNTNRNAKFAWYVFKNDERIITEWYSVENTFKYKIEDSAIYYFVAFAKDEFGNVISSETEKIQI